MQDKVNRLPKIMVCPYHECLPFYYKDVFVYGNGIVPEQCNHVWYCPKCRKCNPVPEKYNSFGTGFTSQYSKSAALANWNKAVCRRQLSMLKKIIKTGHQ